MTHIPILMLIDKFFVLSREAYIDKIVSNLRRAFPLLEEIEFAAGQVHEGIATKSISTEWLPRTKNWRWRCYRTDWSWDFEAYV